MFSFSGSAPLFSSQTDVSNNQTGITIGFYEKNAFKIGSWRFDSADVKIFFKKKNNSRPDYLNFQCKIVLLFDRSLCNVLRQIPDSPDRAPNLPAQQLNGDFNNAVVSPARPYRHFNAQNTLSYPLTGCAECAACPRRCAQNQQERTLTCPHSLGHESFFVSLYSRLIDFTVTTQVDTPQWLPRTHFRPVSCVCPTRAACCPTHTRRTDECDCAAVALRTRRPECSGAAVAVRSARRFRRVSIFGSMLTGRLPRRCRSQAPLFRGRSNSCRRTRTKRPTVRS